MSDIARELEKRNYRINLPGIVKHVQKLEQARILRSESGSLADEPDARKTIYTLHGKKRIQKIMSIMSDISRLLESNIAFSETAELALRIQARLKATEEEIEKLRTSIRECESGEISKYLTGDEKTNVKLWKTMLALKENLENNVN